MTEKYNITGSACDPSAFLEFDNPTAKIDFITLPLSHVFDATGDLQPLKVIEAAGGKLCFPKKAKWAPEAWNPYLDYENNWITIHDPKPATLAGLIQSCPSVEVREIEIALDYFLKDGTNDRQRLERLHAHIVHSLAPGRFRRRYFDPSKRGYDKDTLRSKNCGTTVIWEGQISGFKVKIKSYIKDRDDGKPTDRHSVRLEITLGQGAIAALFNSEDHMARQCGELKNPTEAELRQQKQARQRFIKLAGSCPAGGTFVLVSKGRFKLSMLPMLVEKLRTELTRFLRIAEGVKPALVRTRASGKRAERIEQANQAEKAKALRGWREYGSAWAHRHGLTIKPNKAANDGIGKALYVLQRQISAEIAKKIAQNADLTEVEGM